MSAERRCDRINAFAMAAIQGGLCFHQEDGCIRSPDEAARLAFEVAAQMMAISDRIAEEMTKEKFAE